MAEWLPKDPATLVEIGTAVGGAGLVGKFWDNIASWLGKSSERHKSLQDIIDARLTILLDADEKRLGQMGEEIAGLRAEVAGSRTETSGLREETASLKKMVQTLISHMTSLESILRANRLDVPPRPFAPVE